MCLSSILSDPFPGAPGRTSPGRSRPVRQAMAAKAAAPRNLRQAAARNLRPGSPFVPRGVAGVPSRPSSSYEPTSPVPRSSRGESPTDERGFSRSFVPWGGPPAFRPGKFPYEPTSPVPPFVPAGAAGVEQLPAERPAVFSRRPAERMQGRRRRTVPVERPARLPAEAVAHRTGAPVGSGPGGQGPLP